MRAAAGRTPSRRAAGKLRGGRDEHGWPPARMVIMTALQRQPAYRVAVVNRRHAGLFAVAGDRIDTVAQPAAAGVRSPRYGGWYGLESHRVNKRIAELAHRHFRDIVGILAQAIRPGQERLVVGGHADAIPRFLAILPPDLRDRFFGSFVADTSAIIPARVRALAVPIIRNWVERSEPQLVAQIRLEPPGGLAATGLAACLTATRQHAVHTLAMPCQGPVRGFACRSCGTVGATGTGCAHPGLLRRLLLRMAQDRDRVGGQPVAQRPGAGGSTPRPALPGDRGPRRLRMRSGASCLADGDRHRR
jgi:Bacterial archaeo-eukaryotic release factor family 10